MVCRVKTAIFPVAGLGTRFLPVTKSIPKEMIPLVDRPLIQHAVEEALAAGIERIVFVTAPGKVTLAAHFQASPELENALAARGNGAALDALRAATMPSGAVACVSQPRPLGLGHAVLCARELAGDGPVAVLLPDDVIEATTPCIGQLVEAHAECGGTVLATMRLPREQISSYGVIEPFDTPAGAADGRLVAVRGLVEKPAAQDAPSDLAVIGRYILAPSIFRHLARQRPGAGGEIQLTDAIASAAAGGEPVFGFCFEGRRFDCGSRVGFVEATVAFAMQRPEMRDRLGAFLRHEMARLETTVLAAE